MLSAWLSQFPTRPRRNTYRCTIESLGDRCLLSGSPPPLPKVQFESAAREASWGAVEIAVLRVGDLQTTSTVRYDIEGMTATPWVDFIPNSGTLTFGPGVDRATFTVWVRDYGGDKTVRMSLHEPTAAVLGDIATATLTIRDAALARWKAAWTPPAVSQPTLERLTVRRRGKVSRWAAVVTSGDGTPRVVVSPLRKDGVFWVSACPHYREGDGVFDSVQFTAYVGDRRRPKKIVRFVSI